MTSFEEVRRCPKCEEPGEHVVEEDRPLRLPRGAKLIKIYCRNTRCKWLDTPWSVQVNANGTIPPAVLDREKKFRALPSWAARDAEVIQRQYDLETKAGGAEISNPHS